MSHWLIENRVKQQIYVLFALFGIASCNIAVVGLGLKIDPIMGLLLSVKLT
jgi:hypothetical protein